MFIRTCQSWSRKCWRLNSCLCVILTRLKSVSVADGVKRQIYRIRARQFSTSGVRACQSAFVIRWSRSERLSKIKEHALSGAPKSCHNLDPLALSLKDSPYIQRDQVEYIAKRLLHRIWSSVYSIQGSAAFLLLSIWKGTLALV